MQHKQIRQGENNPHHDGSVRPPQPFQDGNGLPHIPAPGDHVAVQGYNLPPEMGLAETDSNLPVTESGKGTPLSNLDSIGEALPAVSK